MRGLRDMLARWRNGREAHELGRSEDERIAAALLMADDAQERGITLTVEILGRMTQQVDACADGAETALWVVGEALEPEGVVICGVVPGAPWEDGVCGLWSLYVRPGARRRPQVVMALLRGALQWAETRGITRFRLAVEGSQEDAMRRYGRRLGARHEETQHIYTLDAR